MACLTAGRVGCGGGPGHLFFPARLGKPSGLQKGVGHHRHQGVPVQSDPRASLEVVQTQLALIAPTKTFTGVSVDQVGDVVIVLATRPF